MSRLREGRANTARGAAHFLRETVGRVRYGGARGQLTVRADSGFYAHTVAACREMDVRFSITIRQRASLRDLIEAIPEEDLPFPTGWTAPPMSPLTPRSDQAGRRAGAAHCPAGEADARFPARPLRPSYHAFITDRDGETLELEADHRGHAVVHTPYATSSTASG